MSRPQKRARAEYPAWVLWAALTCGLGLAFLADGPTRAALLPYYHAPFAELLSHTVRWLGVGYVQVASLFLLASAGLLISRRAVRTALWALAAFLLSGLVTNILKVVAHRPRPLEESLPSGDWYDYLRHNGFHSFPSGDPTTTFAIALVIGAFFPAWRIPLLIAAVAVAITRVMVGAHYPSDVVAGAMVGIAAGQLIIRFAKGRAPAERSR